MTKSVDDVHCIDAGYLNAKHKLENADIGKENQSCAGAPRCKQRGMFAPPLWL